jgi:hypothetical protein
VTERLNKARKERAISSFQQQAPSAAKVGLCHPPPACRRLLGVHLLGRVSAGNVRELYQQLGSDCVPASCELQSTTRTTAVTAPVPNEKTGMRVLLCRLRLERSVGCWLSRGAGPCHQTGARRCSGFDHPWPPRDEMEKIETPGLSSRQSHSVRDKWTRGLVKMEASMCTGRQSNRRVRGVSSPPPLVLQRARAQVRIRRPAWPALSSAALPACGPRCMPWRLFKSRLRRSEWMGVAGNQEAAKPAEGAVAAVGKPVRPPKFA